MYSAGQFIASVTMLTLYTKINEVELKVLDP